MPVSKLDALLLAAVASVTLGVAAPSSPPLALSTAKVDQTGQMTEECMTLKCAQDESVREQREKTCCVQARFIYHCQERYNSDNTVQTASVAACLQPHTCRTGYFAKVMVSEVMAWMQCVPCSEGDPRYYQPEPEVSYKFWYQHCKFEKTNRGQNEILCKSGGDTEDDTFRCHFENGYAPALGTCPDKCFSQSSGVCYCEKKFCKHNEILNEDYMCVSAPEGKSAAEREPTVRHRVVRCSQWYENSAWKVAAGSKLHTSPWLGLSCTIILLMVMLLYSIV